MSDTKITADFSQFAGHAESVDWRVSAQWASRPDEHRYSSVDEMLDAMQARKDRSNAVNLPLRDIMPALTDDGEFALDVQGTMLTPTNFSLQQYCGELGVQPSLFTRALAGNPRLMTDVLQHCMRVVDDKQKIVQAFYSAQGMRAITTDSYGRIYDADMLRAIKAAIESSGVSWQVPVAFRVPGAPRLECVEVSKADTTLYASDRDQFGFLVDQNNPIECGKLPNGDPDLYFRGFYWWNGECGGIANGISTFLYRYVCCNRSIRGQKGFESIRIIHGSGAESRFVKKLIPALKQFVNGSATGIIEGMNRARQIRIARTDDDRRDFLVREGQFNLKEAEQVMGLCITEEGRPIETIYDVMQGITAFARGVQFQPERVAIERRVGKIMDAVLV